MEGVDRTQLRFQNGAEVRNFDPLQYFDRREIDLLDRFAQFGAISAREAVADAGIEFTPELRERTAIVTGSCVGGQGTEDEGFVSLYRRNNPRGNPLTIPRVMNNAGASRISQEFGIVGDGDVDVALGGGSEAIFSMGFLKSWEAMRVVSADTCRPFSKDRRGLILGEGGACLVMESLESAQARGARIHGEIVGFGMSADAHHITQPLSEGAARAMRLAMADGELQPEQIGYINAHGTGTTANDSTETAAIRSVFGKHADRLAVSSTKSMHGHALGAAGAIEAVATILALECGTLPPTANYNEPDPACDLDVIPNQARAAQVECALSNSFAFGGLNAVIAIKRWI